VDATPLAGSDPRGGGPAARMAAAVPGARSHRPGAVAVVLLAPACLLFALFVVYPILASLRLSLFDWGGIGEKRWVGLGNYQELLADPVFHTALRNSALWLLLFMLAPVAGLAIAILLNQDFSGIRLISPHSPDDEAI
jgi:multiple sugar transport system permease protein